ncbi:MAG: response regulator transcription factor [Bacteroidia bacterium]|nr:response regulator transcription factor [Bacteroidia bacterium]
METKIRIAIVDDHELLRKGLLLQLEEIKNIKIISEFENGQEFVDSLEKIEVDLVFMDIDMPVLNGIEATRQAIQKYSLLKVIALTRENDIESFQNMLDAGAQGFLLKNIKKDTLARAIDAVMKGNNYYSEEMLEILTRNFLNPKKDNQIILSNREKEILNLICQGLQSAEIGKKLFISHRTVDGHRANIMEKLEVKNTVGLILYAIKNNLVELD